MNLKSYGVKDFRGMRCTATELFEEAKDFLCGNFDIAELMESQKDKKVIRFKQDAEDVMNTCKVR